MWNGDLSNLVDRSGNLTVIYDPLTTDAAGMRQPFPGNRIPSHRISNLAKLLQRLTHPATNDINPLLGNNLITVYPRTNDENKLTLKGDHALSSQDQLSVRWTRSVNSFAVEGGRFGNPVDASAGLGTGRSDAEVNNVSVNHTRTFSPRMINELLVGVHRSFKSSGTLADFTNYPDQLGLPNPFGVTGWPTLYASGGYPWAYWDSDNRKDEALTGIILQDNATWIRGGHTFQFGANLRREYNNVRELQQAQGSHSWDGTWTALYDPIGDQAVSRTGHGFADLLLGLPTFLSNQFNRGYFYFRQTEIGLYFMDKWKVTPNLTLNLGVRWDKWTPYDEKHNRLAGIDRDTVFDRFEVVTPNGHDMRSLPGIPPAVLDSWANRGLSFTTADAIGYPTKLFRADNNNFGPRVGFAWRLGDKMVLRGGYGEYFWPMPLSQILQTSRTNPPLNLRFTNEPNFLDGSGTWTLRNQPRPEHFTGNVSVSTEGIVRISPSARSGLLWDGRNWKDARSQNWNLTLEQEILPDTVLRLSYIGNHGRDLEQRAEVNSREAEFNYVARTGEPPPGFRDNLRRNPNWNLRELNRTGFSNSHSGQIEIERRYSNGLAFQWFYTFTRALTTTDAGGFTSGNTSINSIGGGGKVPENHQIMGNPNLSYDQRLRLVYFNNTNVPPHRIRYNGIIDLPFGRGQRFGADATGFLNQLIGGWQIAWIGDWRSGMWSSINSSRYFFENPVLDPDQRLEMTIFGRRQRLWFRGDFDPSQASNVTGGDLTSLVSPDCTQRVVRQLGPNCDNRLPQELNDGSIRFTSIRELYNPSARAFYRGPGAWNVDLSIFKHFYINEQVRLRFTADFFNVFNHPLDRPPSNTTGLQDLSRQNNEPRTIQLSLRLTW